MTMAAKATIPPAGYSIGKLNSGFKKSYLAEIIQIKRGNKMSDRRYVKTPDFIVTKIKDLPVSYTTGVVGGLRPNDAHILFIADRVELVAAEMPGTQKIKAINQEVQAEVHM
ncbi:hypothetical protein MUO66_07325, partial [Candidatus Bathyarchaeota archaeon]|nr:hypothetical protein [Candidatus Bathyarchaeota archaeon]